RTHRGLAARGAGRRAGGRCRVGRVFELVTEGALVELRADADIDAPIAFAPLRRLVVRDRARLAVADRADAEGLDAELADEVAADGFRALTRQRHVRFVAAVRIGMPFDHDLRAGENVDRLPYLVEQRTVRRVDVGAAARERQADHPQQDLVAFARDARLVALEHALDPVELLAHARFLLEALNQRDALL